MLRKVFFVLITALIILGCEQPANEIIRENEIIKEVSTTNNIPIIWKGSLPYAPENPSVGWAYYDTTQKTAFIWNGNRWEILAQDGVSIIWKGELPLAPSNPQLNWAYYNIIDGNSYIYNGNQWDLLAKAGRDGASGILLWIGTLSSAPPNPQAGWAYHDSTDGVSYIYDGVKWAVLVRDGVIWKGVLSAAPADPQINWAYYNTTTSKSYIWDGNSWQIMAESGNTNITVPISWKGSLTSAPFNPQIGWMYYNSVLGKSYIWDGTSWNIVAQDGLDGVSPEGFLIAWKGALASAPSSPQKGWAYYNTSEKRSYIWDGSTWQILAQDGVDGSGSGSGSVTYGPWLYVILYTSKGNYTQYYTNTFDTVDFGKVGLGGSVRSTTFYIGINGGNGNSTLNLTGNPAIQVSGINADCFSVIQPSTTNTTTGTYITDASIVFSPNSIGIKTATITIPNDSPDNPNFSFTVTGTGSMWPKTYDGGEGDGDDVITCSVIDSAGSIYFIGYGFELVNHHSGSDWWIKKIDNSGNEITSGWDKKIDLYGSTSTSRDKPTNAVIDSNNNVYVSDDYFTLKFASNGTEDTSGWRKGSGGTLYLDSQNNVFIVTSSSITKYNPAGTQQWTKAYGGGLAFDSSNNIAVFSSNTLRYVSSGGTENWTKSLNNIAINPASNSDGWYNGYIAANGGIEEWEFTVSNGNTYYVSWNQNGYGDGSMNAIIRVSAYWKDNSANIFTNTQDGWGTPKSFTATKSGTVVVKVETYSTFVGTYAIKCYNSSNTPLTTTRLASMYINNAVFDSTNNLYIAGYGTNIFDNYSKRDVWIKKYNSTGTEITSGWNKKYDWGHSDDEYATKIFFDGTNIIVAGQGNDLINGASADDGWVKRFSTSGTELSSFVIPDANATLVKYDGNYWFTGGSSTYNLALRKYNASGVLSVSFNNLSDYVYYPVFTIDSSYNVYVSGYKSNLITPESKNDWIIRKYNSAGIEQ